MHSLASASRAKHEEPEVPEFYRRLNVVMSLEERIKIWKEFENYFLREMVYTAPLGRQISVVPYRNYVKGVPIPRERVQENPDFATVWLDK